ncbi:MAG TPA: methyltransferase domain-containing protein [Polyangia bacterium]|nr:methyltransferase domain-containing protein [Polyangia bacterium]
MRAKRNIIDPERLAKIYDAEILPLWEERFGRLLLRHLALPPRARVLDAGCATGDTTLKLLRHLDDQGRIVAIDPLPALLDVARDKAGPLEGKRIFFRSEAATPHLSFDNDVYDLVAANLLLSEVDEPGMVVSEFARVTRPGGRVIATLPLDGTLAEFYDLFREALVKLDAEAALERLEGWLGQQPTADTARIWFERADLLDVHVAVERFTLLFASGRDFLLAPLVRHLWLDDWHALLGKDVSAPAVLEHVRAAIDSYFRRVGHPQGAAGPSGPFGVTVVAGCVSARKPTAEEARELFKPSGRPLRDLHLLDEARELLLGQERTAQGSGDVVREPSQVTRPFMSRDASSGPKEVGPRDVPRRDEPAAAAPRLQDPDPSAPAAPAAPEDAARVEDSEDAAAPDDADDADDSDPRSR